jgi:hypothetical protein
VLNAKRVTPPTVLVNGPNTVWLLALPPLREYGSNARLRNCVTNAALLLNPEAELSRPGGIASKLDGDPTAVSAPVGSTPGGATDSAIWMFAEL